MSNLTTFRNKFVKVCKYPIDYVSDLILFGYVKWIIWNEQAKLDAEELVYKMNEKMKDR